MFKQFYLPMIILVAALALGISCKKKGSENYTYTKSDIEKSVEKMGPGAECTWSSPSSSNREVICIVGGKRYVCIAAQCAVYPPVLPERGAEESKP